MTITANTVNSSLYQNIILTVMRRTILLGDRLAGLAGDGLTLLLADVGALQVSVFNICVDSVKKC